VELAVVDTSISEKSREKLTTIGTPKDGIGQDIEKEIGSCGYVNKGGIARGIDSKGSSISKELHEQLAAVGTSISEE
jgi:hypothetical protein